MDINFPLILVLLVMLTGLIWLGDRILLRPGRSEAAARFRKSSSASGLAEEKMVEAIEKLEREPVVVE